jgi:hypothetical protein
MWSWSLLKRVPVAFADCLLAADAAHTARNREGIKGMPTLETTSRRSYH